MLTQLHRYKPPEWAKSLKNIPQHFVQVRGLNCACAVHLTSVLPLLSLHEVVRFLPSSRDNEASYRDGKVADSPPPAILETNISITTL